ncbi:MAG TPA: hypothetical protein VK066_14860 [Chloroflexota bacterium]|nr:hypothetical protein [Chloroflexota bacterium]
MSVQTWAVGRALDRAVATHVFGDPPTADPPAYSADIAAAWRIVYQLQARGWSLLLHGRLQRDDPVWTCTVMGPEGPVVYAHGPIAALTLCRAALLATTSPAPPGD